MKNIKAKILRHQQHQGPAEYLCTHTGQGMEKPVLPSCLMLLQGLWSSLEAAGQSSPLEQLCCTQETKSETPPTPESCAQPTAPQCVSFSPLELKLLVRTQVLGLPKCHQTAKSAYASPCLPCIGGPKMLYLMATHSLT